MSATRSRIVSTSVRDNRKDVMPAGKTRSSLTWHKGIMNIGSACANVDLPRA